MTLEVIMIIAYESLTVIFHHFVCRTRYVILNIRFLKCKAKRAWTHDGLTIIV